MPVSMMNLSHYEVSLDIDNFTISVVLLNKSNILSGYLVAEKLTV